MVDLHLPTSPSGHQRHRSSISSTTSSGASASSAPLNSKTHKHFQSLPTEHYSENPSTSIKHAATFGPSLPKDQYGDENGSPQSHHQRFKLPSIPDPITATRHVIEDHLIEYKYEHGVRAAKKEAARLQTAHSKPSRFSIDFEKLPTQPVTEGQESDEEYREKAEQAWADEVSKRERARRRTSTWNDERPSSEWQRVLTEESSGRRTGTD